MTTLECPICYDEFNEDALMICSSGHAHACGICVSMIDSDKCSICRKIIFVEEEEEGKYMNVWEWRKWVEEWEWGRWLERAGWEVWEEWGQYMTWEEWENSEERREWLELADSDESDLRAEWNEWRCGGSQSYNYCEYNIGGYGHIVYDEESLERLVNDIEEKEDEGEYMNVFQWRHWVEEWEWMRWMEWAEWAEWEERNNRPGVEYMTWEDWVVSQEYMDWAEYALDRDDSDLGSEWTTWLAGGCQSYCYGGEDIGGYYFIVYEEESLQRLVNDFHPDLIQF